MKPATNRETRQARCFLYRREVRCSRWFCEMFARVSKALGLSFAETFELMELHEES